MRAGHSWTGRTRTARPGAGVAIPQAGLVRRVVHRRGAARAATRRACAVHAGALGNAGGYYLRPVQAGGASGRRAEGRPGYARVARWSEAASDIRDIRKMSADGPLACEDKSRDLLTASLGAATVKSDDQGNVRLIKNDTNNTARDDVAAALVLACGEFARGSDSHRVGCGTPHSRPGRPPSPVRPPPGGRKPAEIRHFRVIRPVAKKNLTGPFVIANIFLIIN